MKEADSSYKGRMLSMTFPFSKRELVLSRYLSCCLYQLYGLGVMILFLTLHFLIYRTYSPVVYLGILAGGLLITLFMTADQCDGLFCWKHEYFHDLLYYFCCAGSRRYVLYLFLDIDLLDLLGLPLPLLWGIAVGDRGRHRDPFIQRLYECLCQKLPLTLVSSLFIPSASPRHCCSLSIATRYCWQFQAKPVAVRCPANVCSCKHGSRLPGISHKIPLHYSFSGCSAAVFL